MLIGIPPLLGPSLLACLRAMGHGDEVAIVDGNYPAEAHGQRIIRADGIDFMPMVEAILTVLPVDDFVDEALFRSTRGADVDAIEPVHTELMSLCARMAPDRALVPLPGAAFYERVKACHVIVATSEPRLYANMIIRKGVIHP